MDGKKRTIILAMPEHFKLHEPFIKNLTYCGFDVISITLNDTKYYYKNNIERVINFINKLFFRNNIYKKKLLLKSRGVYDRINQININADYALFIRPDVYAKDVLRSISSKSIKMIGYQWDGMACFPLVYSYVKYFDRFFVFDKPDYKPPTLILPTTNFYFDYPIRENPNILYDVFYVGSYIINRMDNILKLATALKQFNLQIQINIFKDNDDIEPKYKNSQINFIKDIISYQENLEMAKNSKILLDFQDIKHQGLSLRVFESIGFEKKLITNNAKVKDYDFYHPNNILVWENDNDLKNLGSFINSPYSMINCNIREKYSFSNWIKYLLDIEPHIVINFP